MRIKDILMIQGYVKRSKYRSIWRRLVRMMACVVVFCTTYALILPVITLERTYICGQEVHSHSDQCRAGPEVGTYLCTPEELDVHEHTDDCFDPEGMLLCGMADRILHTHDEACFGQEGQLLCLLPQIPEHTHSEDCFSGEAIICGLEELTEHYHTDECFNEEDEIICGCLEAVVHQHDASCPLQDGPEWGCGLTEHTHDDGCVEVRLVFLPMAQGDAANLTLNFTSYSEWNPIEFPGGNTYSCRVGDVVTIRVADTDSSATYVTPSITLTGCELVSISTPCGQNHGSHNENGWYSCGFAHEIVVRITDTNATVVCSLPGDNWPAAGNSVTIGSSGGTDPTDPPVTDPPVTDPPVTDPPVTDPPVTDPPVTDPPVTEPPVTEPPVTEPEPTEPEIIRPGYPTAVKTGKSDADTLYFYNFAADSSTVKPLAGCVFRITGITDDGQRYSATITSGEAMEVYLPADIPAGSYTITELSAPNGYMRDTNYTRNFRVGYSEVLGHNVFMEHDTIGSFLNHSLEDLDAGKTAEVEDYNNRTYEIILKAESSIRLYEIEPIDVLFVVDQSNSMLFPSGLEEVAGKTITLYQNPKYHEAEGRWTWGGWVEDKPAWHENITELDNLGLDKNQVYYIIADPEGTSTVFAVWHNGERWMFQDASYYAKAFYDNAEGYQQAGELAIFPEPYVAFSDQPTQNENGQKVRANGGDIGMTIEGTLGNYIGSGSSKTFQIYTAIDQYNRLHYLEESITQAVYQLSDANVENTATVIRFTKSVDEEHCIGPYELTPDNASLIVDSVNKINTAGGTRQDLALEHAYKHLTGQITYKDGSSDDKFTKPKSQTFTILITDGAPVRSDNTAPELNVIYDQIRNNGALVRQESTLVTVGLGMDAVEGGKEVLEDIASAPMYANIMQDASDLSEMLHDLLFNNLKPKQTQDISGDITDVISNSFYPIAWVNQGSAPGTGRQYLHSDGARDWIVLEPGDWITLDGKYVGPRQGSTGQGQLNQDEDGTFFIQWQDRTISDSRAWEGRFFVKAKEDFIGGNAIETNIYAAVDVGGTELMLPMPTVNVRLLDMNENSSEVTVYLGDTINEPGDSPYDALRWFYDQTRFEKLVEDFPNQNGLDYGPILNARDPDDDPADGLEAGEFYLRYALGNDLTEEQWAHLLASEENTVQIDYTYDDDSHGPVGYFTFRLTKNGETADYDSHEATQVGQRVEDYTLHVTYTAYELGESSVLDPTQIRPEVNVHNGTGSPGTEVSPDSGDGALEDGYGIVDKDNVHIVNVICGSIEVTKHITPELISDEDQTYWFTLLREEDNQRWNLEVTVPAGETTGTTAMPELERGTYVLFEHTSDTYNVRAMEIGPDTNCYGTIQNASARFHMGYDPEDKNVIGKWPGDRYTSYTGSPNGVFAHALVTNEKTVHYGEIPVEKIWSDGAQSHDNTPVYVLLYQTGDHGDELVLDPDGRARILRLDAGNGWTGSFRVALPEKGADPADLGYFVREAQGVSTLDSGGAPAILENDGVTVLYSHGAAEPEDVLLLGSGYYMVTYQQNAETGGWTVTNSLAVILPATGGTGTTMYTLSGLLLTAAALVLGYSQRRRRERGAAP